VSQLADRRARRLRRKREKKLKRQGVDPKIDSSGCYDAREIYAKVVTDMLEEHGIYGRYGRDVYLRLAREIPHDDDVGFHRTYADFLLDALNGDDKKERTRDILRAKMAHDRGERTWL
jgi:hypothetical protein